MSSRDTYEHRPEDLIDTLRQEVRPGDLIVLPVTRSRGRLPYLGARVADELPDIPLLIVIGGAPSRLGELPHARLTAEFPFSPPPWTCAARPSGRERSHPGGQLGAWPVAACMRTAGVSPRGDGNPEGPFHVS